MAGGTGALGAGDVPVDPAGALLPVVRTLETGGQKNPDTAVSPTGAIGRNQIEPGTAKQYGFDPGRLTDGDYNDQAAHAILTDLVSRYHGDTKAALAGYNGGPGRGDQYVKAGDDPSVLPTETQNYLTKAGALPDLSALQQPQSGALDPADQPVAAPQSGALDPADQPVTAPAAPAQDGATLDAPMALMGPGDYTNLAPGAHYVLPDGRIFQKGTAPGGKDAFITTRPAKSPGIMDTIKGLFTVGQRPNQAAPEDSAITTAKDVGKNFIQGTKASGGALLQALAETPAEPNIPGFNADTDPQGQPVKEMGKTLKALTDVPGTPGNVGKRIFAAAQAQIKANAPNVPENSAKDWAYKITSNLAQVAPYFAASAATRSPAPALLGIFAQSYGDSYAQARAAGRDPEQAQSEGLFSATASAVPAMIPLHVIMKPGQSFLGKTFKEGLGFAAQNMMTTTLQKAYDAGILKENMTWGEAMTAIAKSGIEGFVSGLAFGAGHGAVEAGANKIADIRTQRAAAAAQPKVEPGPASGTPPPDEAGLQEPQAATPPPGPKPTVPDEVANPPAPAEAAQAQPIAPPAEPAAAPAQSAQPTKPEGSAAEPVPMRGPEPFTPVLDNNMFQTAWKDANGNTFPMRDPRITEIMAKGPLGGQPPAKPKINAHTIQDEHDQEVTRLESEAFQAAAKPKTPLDADTARKALETNIDPATGQRPVGNAALREFRAKMQGVIDSGPNVSHETAQPQPAAKKGFNPADHVDEARAAQIGREKPLTAAQLGAKLKIGGPRAARVIQAMAKAPADPEFDHTVDYVRQARAPDPKGESLFDAIRRHGGISDAGAEGGDLRQIMQNYTRPGARVENAKEPMGRRVLRPDGIAPDQMRRLLQDEKWFGTTEDKSGPNAQATGSYPGDDMQDLYDLMDKEARGEKVYQPESSTAHDLYARRMMDEELGRAGVGANDSDAVAARKLMAWRKSEGADSIPAQHQAMVDQGVGSNAEIAKEHGYEPGADIGEEQEERGGAAPREPGPAGAARGSSEAEGPGGPSGRDHDLSDEDIPFARRPGNGRVERDQSSGFDFEPSDAVDGAGRKTDQLINEAGGHSARQLAAAREAQGHGKIAPKAAQKGAGPLFGEEEEKPAEQKGFDFARRSEPFYSALTRNIEEMKQEKAPAAQWSSIIDNLKAKGVKQEEIDWSGVKDWLADQKGAVSKGDLLQHLRENEVRVQEVEHGGSVPEADMRALHDWVEKKHPDLDYTDTINDAMRGDAEAIGKVEELGPPEKLMGPIYRAVKGGATKFSSYTLPGGENYRELLLTLPPREQDFGISGFTPFGGEGVGMFEGQRRVEGVKEARFHIGDNEGRITYWPHTFDHMGRDKGPKYIVNSRDIQNARFDTAEDAIKAIKDSYAGSPEGRAGNAMFKSRKDMFRTDHWAEPNVLAHIRFDDRTGPNGEKVLHVAEIQSDWHQKGRREGYGQKAGPTYFLRKPDGDTGQDFSSREEGEEYLRQHPDAGILDRQAPNTTGVPDAPFKTSWHELALKRMLRYAAEHGYDRLSWDTGDTNAERYDLSTQVHRIDWTPDGERKIVSITPKDGNVLEFAVRPDGKIEGFGGAPTGNEYDGKQIHDVVGKDIGDKIMGDRHGDLSGNGLKVGGDGMRGFYDKILPAAANKLGKKFGAKVESGTVSSGGEPTLEYEGPHATLEQVQEAYKAALANGQIWKSPITGERQELQVNRVANASALKGVLGEMTANGTSFADAMNEHGTAAVAKLFGGEMAKGKSPVGGALVHSMPITPAMREGVMAGQPLFNKAPEGWKTAGGETPGGEGVKTRKVGKVNMAFDPKFTAKRAEIGAALRARLDKMGLHDIALKLPDKIWDTDADRGLSGIDGFYSPGMKTIFTALDATNGVEHVADHEAIHALKDLGVFTPEEWKILTAKAPEWIKKYKIDKTYAYNTAAKQPEEAVAHAFPDWRKGKLGNSGNAVQRIFNKVKNVLEAIRNSLHGLGFKSVDSIFRNIEKGKIGRRGTEEDGGAEPSFARRGNKEDEERNLIVQHNTTAENLRHADRMGGFAAPSVAITKVDHPLDGFGEISLLGDKDMADPRGRTGTKVFGADIYSPRYPEISYKPDKAALQKINDKLAPYREGDERPIYGSDINKADDLGDNRAFRRYAKDTSGQEYPDHRAMAHDLLREAGAPEKIFRGFNNNGNRRYTPHTLDNVIKILKKEIRGGENWNYGVGSLRAKYTPQFRSLDQIRGAKDRLMSDGDFEKAKKEIDEKFWDVAGELKPHYKYSSNEFGFGDTVINVLGDSAKQGLRSALKEYGFEDVPDDVLSKTRDFLESLRHLPTEYFEGKIPRGVGIHEFHSAVIPHDTKPETRALLEKRGLQTFEYKRNDKADRARAIKEAAEANKDDLMFARRRKEPEPPKRDLSWLGKVDSVIGEKAEGWGKKIGDLGSSIAPESVKDAKAAVQMALTPMATGTAEARAPAKDFANSVRAAYERGSRNVAALKEEFSPDQLRKMWEAADEQSVAMQQGRPTEGIGLGTLPEPQRKAVEAMQADADTVMDHAIKIGLYKGDKMPSYVPRMVVAVAADGSVDRLSYGGDSPSSLNAIGKNLRTTSANLKHRKYLTAAETEAAARHISPDAVLVRDIRTLPLATARLRQAVAGRTLINTIREIGNSTGEDTVVEGAIPEGSPHKWFTIDHPAFKTYKPKMIENTDTGEWEPLKDESGNVVLQKVPLYVRGDFEGPLRAVLRKDHNALYKAYMTLKGKSMSVIMYSPLMHNAVIWGKALPVAPLKMLNPIWKDGEGKWHLGLELYGRGNQARMSGDTMHEATMHGLVPIGRHFAMQDVSGIMETGEEPVGRSWTAKAAGALARPLGENARQGMMGFIDKAGDFWHNTLLWDRVADLQMGIYSLLRDRATDDGMDPVAARRYAAHFANRYAGAMPLESLSQTATAWSNFLLFSRSFNGTNIGAYKDFLMGLPKDVQAQIMRDAGPEALQNIQGTARRKGAVMMMTDIALSHVSVYLAQAALAWVLARQFFPPSDNEPGYENRVYLGESGDGRSLYGRLPVGKVGEDFQNWVKNPIGTGERKMSGVASWMQEIASNQDFWGNKIYDPLGSQHIGPWFENFGKAAERLAEHLTPLQALQGAKDWLLGDGDERTNALRTVLPLLGITVSRGAPGGPAMSVYYKARDEYNFRLQKAMPDIKEMVKKGDLTGAEKAMDEVGVPRSEQRFIIRGAQHPGLTRGKMRSFQSFATPEQQDRMKDARQRARDQHSELEPGLEDALKGDGLSDYAASGATWSRAQAVSAAKSAGLSAVAALLKDAREPAGKSVQRAVAIG